MAVNIVDVFVNDKYKQRTLSPQTNMYDTKNTCRAGMLKNGKEKGVYAKMARGAMVRYLAENQIENIKDITQFSDLGYTFDASQSTEKNYIFKKKLSS